MNQFNTMMQAFYTINEGAAASLAGFAALMHSPRK